MLPLDWPEADTEDPRTQLRRRYQQRRCLVCGARNPPNRRKSSFCARHADDWRYCSTCATLQRAASHGKDDRCKRCAARKALAQYHADPDRCLYRIRLKQLSRRRHSAADMIFLAIRRQIALADLVRRTPGWSWRRRGRATGWNATYLVESYRRQNARFATTTTTDRT